MRRLVSSLTLGLALLCASLAWSAFTTRSTFLDAHRSERIADALIADPVVRDAAAKGLSEALQRALPPGTPISSAQVEAATRTALDDPRAIAALKTAVVGAHQRLVGEATGPITLDARPIAEAGRDALIASHPELAAALPAVPELSIELPTEKLPKLGNLREPLGVAAGLGSLAAVALLTASFALSKERYRVLGRLGRWAVGIGLWWAVIGYGLPRLAASVGDPRLAILGSLGKAVSAPLVAPAVGLFIAGIGAMIAARLWRSNVSRPPAVAPMGPEPVLSEPRVPFATPPRPRRGVTVYASPPDRPRPGSNGGGNTWVA